MVEPRQSTPRQRLEALRILRGCPSRRVAAERTHLSPPTILRLETTDLDVGSKSLRAWGELVELEPDTVQALRKGKLRFKLDLVKA
jgi:hypothetical protein